MTSEWPIRPGSGRAFSRPSPAALTGNIPAWLDDATTDLFLPARHRVSDRLRASASVMLDALVGSIERDMRLALAAALTDRAEIAASLASASVAIAIPLLGDAGTLRHPPLVALLLRRAGQFVLAQRLLPPGAERSGLLIDDSESTIAAAAMALVIAEARRVDRFGDPALLVDDLPAELAYWLTWQVAAALRHYLCAQHGLAEADADALVPAAAQTALATHDEGRGLEAAAAWLAARLAADERIDGALLQALLTGGDVAAFTAALASAARIAPEQGWDFVAEPAVGRLASLLCAAGVDRASAAAILLLLVKGDAAAELDRFDACDRQAVVGTFASLALEPQYRAAIAAIDSALAAREDAA